MTEEERHLSEEEEERRTREATEKDKEGSPKGKPTDELDLGEPLSSVAEVGDREAVMAEKYPNYGVGTDDGLVEGEGEQPGLLDEALTDTPEADAADLDEAAAMARRQLAEEVEEREEEEEEG